MIRTPNAFRYIYLMFAAAVLLVQALPRDAAFAQARRDIAVLVTQVKAGAQDEVAKLLPVLKKSHPDKAGVLFLEALLESDAEKSVDLYQRVADEFGDSDWADDALYRLYQYSFAVGAYRTARSYIERIAKDHPQSPFLTREQSAEANGSTAMKQASTVNGSSGKGSQAKKESSAATPEKSATGVVSDGGTFAVQVGAFARETDARKQLDELKTKGYTAYLREKTVKGKTVQAVWLGIFPDFTRAQAFASKLKEQQDIDGIVVRR